MGNQASDAVRSKRNNLDIVVPMVSCTRLIPPYCALIMGSLSSKPFMSLAD